MLCELYGVSEGWDGEECKGAGECTWDGEYTVITEGECKGGTRAKSDKWEESVGEVRRIQ